MSRPAEHALQAFFDDAGREFTEVTSGAPGVRQDLDFGVRRVRMEFAGRALAEALLPAFAPRATTAGGEPDLVVQLWESTTPVPWKDHHMAAGGLLRGRDGDPVTIVNMLGAGSITMTGGAPGRVLIRFGPVDTVPWWERAAPLRPALSLMLGGPDSGLLHGGAVGDERGGVLLGGPGGSGKTTTALSALSAGWRYVGDDYFLLDVTGGAPVARNLFGTAKVDPARLATFPRLAPWALPLADEEGAKAIVDVAGGLPETLADTLPIRAVVVPRITGGTSRHWPISGVEALRLLAPSTMFQLPYDDGQIFHLMRRLVRRVPCYALGVGDDQAQLVEALGAVLDEASA